MFRSYKESDNQEAKSRQSNVFDAPTKHVGDGQIQSQMGKQSPLVTKLHCSRAYVVPTNQSGANTVTGPDLTIGKLPKHAEQVGEIERTKQACKQSTSIGPQLKYGLTERVGKSNEVRPARCQTAWINWAQADCSMEQTRVRMRNLQLQQSSKHPQSPLLQTVGGGAPNAVTGITDVGWGATWNCRGVAAIAYWLIFF